VQFTARNGYQPSALGFQLSAFSSQLSAFSRPARSL
jgi:hypothetical protein